MITVTAQMIRDILSFRGSLSKNDLIKTTGCSLNQLNDALHDALSKGLISIKIVDDGSGIGKVKFHTDWKETV